MRTAEGREQFQSLRSCLRWQREARHARRIGIFCDALIYLAFGAQNQLARRCNAPAQRTKKDLRIIKINIIKCFIIYVAKSIRIAYLCINRCWRSDHSGRSQLFLTFRLSGHSGFSVLPVFGSLLHNVRVLLYP
jgi:hypothetical protein